jgi:dTDP-glucose 4,6-dehydratase
MTTAYRVSEGVDTTIARIFNTFGPRMRPHDGRVIPTFIRQALAGEPLTIAGDGLQTRSVCYVDDLVRGVLALADSDHPGPMNLGNPTELTVRRIGMTYAGCLGRAPVGSGSDR